MPAPFLPLPVLRERAGVLETFGTYFRECRGPSERERAVVEGLCRAAALAIERRRAEAECRESEKKLRVALGAAELGAWTYRMGDGRWGVDARARELYGIEAAVVIHDDALMARIMHPDDIPVRWRAVMVATDPAGAGRYECEYRVRHGDGRRWLAAWAQVEFDIMRELKERYAGRAIALSGYGMESDVAASRAAGFAEHVTKPVDLAALEAAIGRVAGGRG